MERLMDEEGRPYCVFCDAYATFVMFRRQVIMQAPIDTEGQWNFHKEEFYSASNEDDGNAIYHCKKHDSEAECEAMFS